MRPSLFKKVIKSLVNKFSKFGKVISDMKEDKIELEDEEEGEGNDPDVQGIGNGVYSVKMLRLDR